MQGKLLITHHVFSYTSFLEIHGQPLIDLNLYVSSENYHASTRPAYSHILHWPNTWLHPPQRRAAAKARTDHLNFSSLDLDTVDQDEEKKSKFAADTEIPKRLIRSTTRPTASLAKKKNQHAARFRLDRLAEGFLGPLNDLLKGKQLFLSTSEKRTMTSLDCLALGYLALALVPEVPQSWLSDKMKRGYPDLCRYVEDGARECFWVDLSTTRTDREGRQDNTSTTTTTKVTLPHQLPTTSTTSTFLPLLSSLPLFGPLYRPHPIQNSTTTDDEQNHSHNIPIIPSIFLGLTASVAAMCIRVLWTGKMPSFDWVRGVSQRHRMVFRWPFGNGKSGRRLGDMGEAGALLGGVDLRGI
ncbi:MAG: hypothetical protein Q9221_004062 [Calogaya cf. arnoldii]